MSGAPPSPFRAIHADAWAAPTDVTTLNKDASDLILARVEEVRRAGAREDLALTSSCVLLLGPAGAGKTHLFTRLRAQAGRRAVFIHTRPQIGVEPTPRFVLRSILDSLRQRIAGGDEMQIDLVAGAILAAHEGDKPRFPLAKVEQVRALGGDERRALFERVVSKVEERFPGIVHAFLFRLLEVPFASPPDRRALLTWLSGGEPSVVELERIGASGPLPDMDVMSALSTLGIAAAYGAPVVLVFDQLENLAEDGGRTGRVHAHARLVSDLRDTVRGFVIVQMALDAEWRTRIHPALHASDRDRLEETVRLLALPTPDERRALLALWCEALPEDERGASSPFRAADVEAWVHDRGMTPRMLMQASGDAYLRRLDVAPAEAALTPVDHDEPLAGQWAAAVARAREEIDEARGVPAERLAGGLIAALDPILGVGCELAAQRPAYELRVGASTQVVIAQQANHTSLAAALRAAIAIAAGKRVILLRERALAVPPTWKEVDRLLSAFASLPGALFVPLDREDVARTVALEAFVTAARSHDLSADDGRPIPPADVLAWAARTLDCASWGPVRAVVAAPAPAPVPVPVPVPVPPSPLRVSGAGGTPALHAHAHAHTPALRVLERLRVASVERVLREAKAVDPTTTRAAVLDELRRLPVRFFGESVVALTSPWP